MRLHLIYIYLLLLLGLTACDGLDDYSTNPAHTLRFSADTLLLDTVFSEVPTSTRQVMVYNPNQEDLLIQSIALAGGNNSGFRINVDGVSGTSFADVPLAARDSLYIFVEATFGRQADGNRLPTLQKDSILFSFNGNRQEIKLRAYAQDVTVMRGHTFRQDTLIVSDEHILIYDSLVVAPDVCLTVGSSTHFYFHRHAELVVHGTLQVEGKHGEPVTFRGDRTDRLFSNLPYDRLPRQWKGVRFTASSYDNRLHYVDIHGGNYGIQCDSSDLSRRKLTLEHSVIRQVSGCGLSLRHCQALVGNTEISNAGEDCVSITGGVNTFIHCTLANYFSWDVRQGVALRVDEAAGEASQSSAEATFLNCLIAGSASQEVAGSAESLSLIGTVCAEGDDFRQLDANTQSYDFRPTEASEARHAGDVSGASAYPYDRNGVVRPTDEVPDAGCYQYTE